MNSLETVLKISAELAKPFEGLHKVIGKVVRPYHDPVGYPTIGYGHLLSKVIYEPLENYKDWSFITAEEMLKKDMLYATTTALKLSPILGKLENIYRWAAISDFIFNLGEGNYKVSTLKKCIDNGLWKDSVIQIQKWNKAGGKVLKGLVSRRKAESELLQLIYQ